MFHISKQLKPAGDQPNAIKELTAGFVRGSKYQTLLGVTGSGKTLTMAHVIEKLGLPTLVISHNKTLAAQLYEEFKAFFPHDHVHYFVSYYDYYQPEAYLPTSDTYIEKEVQINEEIDRLRHAAVRSVLQYPNTIVVASVSCIYNLGSPVTYQKLALNLSVGQRYTKREFLKSLLTLQFERNEVGFWRGNFRMRDRFIDVWTPEGDTILRVALANGVITKLVRTEAPFGNSKEIRAIKLFPAKFWPSEEAMREVVIANIRTDLKEQLKTLAKRKKILEVERLRRRTEYDLALIKEVGWCKGVENYSRYFENRQPKSPPFTLLDYFPHSASSRLRPPQADYGGQAGQARSTSSGQAKFLTIIDESHMTVPQIRGMHEGDRARKTVLVEHGFRLPSAVDNRPLTFEEFKEHVGEILFVSATPAEYEKRISSHIAEQIVRPTYLLDPDIEIRPTHGQIPDLIREIEMRVSKSQRVLVTVLTKRLAEALAQHLKDKKIKAEYLHSEIETLARPQILYDLRKGKYDVLVGINLLREGLDLPEVSLVTILDADKEGFLRDRTSFIQVSGRAARHLEGHVIMYSDTVTGSMKAAIDEIRRRRVIQKKYNRRHRVKPFPIVKELRLTLKAQEKEAETPVKNEFEKSYRKELRRKLELAQRNLQFEEAARLKTKLQSLKTQRPS